MIVRVVLDTSAILAYAGLEGVAVGELVAMVEEDSGAALVGIPAAGILASYALLDKDDRARLVDLATKIEGVTVILPLIGSDAIEVAEMGDRLAEAGTAHAIIEARTRGALLATYAGDAARRELPHEVVLDLSP